MEAVVRLFLGDPRAQEVIQLGANVLLQQCYKQRLSDWATKPWCESWHSVYPSGPHTDTRTQVKIKKCLFLLLWIEGDCFSVLYMYRYVTFLKKYLLPYNWMFCSAAAVTDGDPYLVPVFNKHSYLQVFLTNSSNVFLLEPCHDVPKLLENQVEVCRAVLSIYRHIIMEHNMNRQTWYSFFCTNTCSALQHNIGLLMIALKWLKLFLGQFVCSKIYLTEENPKNWVHNF